MASYNHSSSYNRTYEKKVIEEAPRIRVTSLPFSSHALPEEFKKLNFNSAMSSFPTSNSFGGTSASLRITDDSFHATIDVKEFAPEDLKVSVIGQHIVVEGNHPEKSDELGLIQRSFVRKFALPRDVQPDSVQSNLTVEGTLTIIALPPKPKEASPSRTIPIKVVTSPAPSSQPSPAPAAATTEAPKS